MRKKSLVQINTFSKPAFNPGNPELLRRKCGCGKCSKCQNQGRAQHSSPTASAELTKMSPILHEALRSQKSQSSSAAELVSAHSNHQVSERSKEQRERTPMETSQSQGVNSASTGTTSNTEQDSQVSASGDKKKIPESLLNGPFFTLEQAAKGFADRFNLLSIKKCEEICSIFVHNIIYVGPTLIPLFYYIDPWQHPDPAQRRDSCTAFPPIAPFFGEKPENFAGEIHTHGCEDPEYDSEEFSSADMRGCSMSGGPCFIVTPKGNIKRRR